MFSSVCKKSLTASNCTCFFQVLNSDTMCTIVHELDPGMHMEKHVCRIPKKKTIMHNTHHTKDTKERQDVDVQP